MDIYKIKINNKNKKINNNYKYGWKHIYVKVKKYQEDKY